MTDYSIFQKSAWHMGNLEKCPKWVLSPSFFSGNMSKMIPGFLLKKLVPPMMDTGGGAGKVPLAHGLIHYIHANQHKLSANALCLQSVS